MIKLEKIYNKFPELDLIAKWRNQSLISLRSNDLTAKGLSQTDWVNSFSHKEKYYFIYIQTLEKFVGYCGLDKINSIHRTAELSLLIAPLFQKHGFGSATTQKLLEMAFIDFNLNCVFIEVILSSTGNIKFWKKQGFQDEGRLRQRYFKNRTYEDSVIASITKDDWLDKKELKRNNND